MKNSILHKKKNLEKAISLFNHLLETYNNPPEVKFELEEEIRICKDKIMDIESGKTDAVTADNRVVASEKIIKAVKKELQKATGLKSESFNYNYKIRIIRYGNGKGSFEVRRKHQRIAISTTEIQTDMLVVMAKNAKQRDKKKQDKDKGWTSAFDFKEQVSVWSPERTQNEQVRTQIDNIRARLKKDFVNEDLIETQTYSGYRISTHPDNITIEK